MSSVAFFRSLTMKIKKMPPLFLVVRKYRNNEALLFFFKRMPLSVSLSNNQTISRQESTTHPLFIFSCLPIRYSELRRSRFCVVFVVGVVARFHDSAGGRRLCLGHSSVGSRRRRRRLAPPPLPTRPSRRPLSKRIARQQAIQHAALWVRK